MNDSLDFEKKLLSLFKKEDDDCLKSTSGGIEIVKENTPEIVDSDDAETIKDDIHLYIEEYNRTMMDRDILISNEGFNTKIKRKLVIEKYINSNERNDIKHRINFSIPLCDSIFRKIKTPKKYINSIMSNLESNFDLSFDMINSLNLYKLVYLSKQGPYKYQYTLLPELLEKFQSIFEKYIVQDIDRLYLLDEIFTSIDKLTLRVGNYTIAKYEELDVYNYKKAIIFYRKNQKGIFDFDTSLNYINTFELYITPVKNIISYFLNIKTKNYIFVPDFQDDADNWAFYYLDREDDDIKYWKLDARMDRFCQVFMDSVEIFLLDSFNLFFTCLFGTLEKKNIDLIDTGREGDIKMIVKSISTIYKSIKMIANKKRLSLEIIKVLTKKIVYTPSTRDVFDRKFDDIVIQQEYREIDSEQILKNEKNIINRLFYFEKE